MRDPLNCNKLIKWKIFRELSSRITAYWYLWKDQIKRWIQRHIMANLKNSLILNKQTKWFGKTYWNCDLTFPSMGLTYVNKKLMLIRLVNKGIKSWEESQETLPNKVENFKRTCSSRMEVFRWPLRNRIGKTDIDGIKTKVWIQHYLKLDEPEGPSLVLQH